MAEIVMPRLSDSMEEGTILTWMKQVGDVVAVGDELVEIETDKANMAYESDVAGTLTQIMAQEGETLAIGSPIAVVGDPGDAPTQVDGVRTDEAPTVVEEAPTQVDEGVREEPVPAPQSAAPAAPAAEGERVKASPLARRIARDKDVDLSTVTGSGPGGRIVKADVEGAQVGAAGSAPARADVPAASAPAPAGRGADAAGTRSAAGETAKGITTYQDLTRLQQVVSRRMAESKATAPHFYLQTEVDMSAAVEARGRIKAMTPEGEVVPSFNDMVVKACALALRDHPLANGAYRDGRFELYSRVNVGVAVAAQDALVVPTVFDADRKGLREIATDARTLAGKVRDGSISPPELSGGTFTVSNLGMYGVTNFSAVINAPQAAILAVGAITEKPVVKDGQITTAHILGVTLACDHRILYGAPAAEFLARIRALLEEPLSLAL
ncbi:MAG TPA: dihydrolipoamide acetyltransferase family protein [Solirubrobacterales bacterium]|jgi:pyruvate dehydrogenase E2 component (dihydrolipoamide acetyltransferase)|nr:dihydrolipoamide acetyltransferase family protein [Solirubrobacterales bacterium]